MLSIRAINDPEDFGSGQAAVARDEHEFQVEVLQEDYERAAQLHRRHLENRSLVSLRDVRVEYEKVLARPIVEHRELRRPLHDMRARVLHLTYRNLGRLHEAGERLVDALDYYVQACTHDARDAPTWVKIGRIAAQLGRWRLARAAYERAFQADPHLPLAQQGLYHVLRAVGDTAAAEALARHLTVTVAQDDEDAEIAALLGLPKPERRLPAALTVPPLDKDMRADYLGGVALARRQAVQLRGKRRALVLEHETLTALGQLLLRQYVELERSSSELALARVSIRTPWMSTEVSSSRPRGAQSSLPSSAWDMSTDAGGDDEPQRSPSPVDEGDMPGNSSAPPSSTSTRKRRALPEAPSTMRKSSRQRDKSSREEEERRKRQAEEEEDVRPLLEWLLGPALESALAPLTEYDEAAAQAWGDSDAAAAVPLVNCFRRALASPELLSGAPAASKAAGQWRSPIAFEDLLRRKKRVGCATIPDNPNEPSHVHHFLSQVTGRYCILDLASALLYHLTSKFGDHYWGTSPALYGVALALHRVVDGRLRDDVDAAIFSLAAAVDQEDAGAAPKALARLVELLRHNLVLYEICLCSASAPPEARAIERALVQLMAALGDAAPADLRIRFLWLLERHQRLAGHAAEAAAARELCLAALAAPNAPPDGSIVLANCPDADVISLATLTAESNAEAPPSETAPTQYDDDGGIDGDVRGLVAHVHHLQELLERPTIESVPHILRGLGTLLAPLAAASPEQIAVLLAQLPSDVRAHFLRNVIAVTLLACDVAKAAAPPFAASRTRTRGAVNAISAGATHPLLEPLIGSSSPTAAIFACRAWGLLLSVCSAVDVFARVIGEPPGYVELPLAGAPLAARVAALAHQLLGAAAACVRDGGVLLERLSLIFAEALRGGATLSKDVRIALRRQRRQCIVCLYGILAEGAPLAGGPGGGPLELDDADLRGVARHRCPDHRALDATAAEALFEQLFGDSTTGADLDMIDSVILQRILAQLPPPPELVAAKDALHQALMEGTLVHSLAASIPAMPLVPVPLRPIYRDLFRVRALDLKTYKEIKPDLFDNLLYDVLLNPERAESWMTMAEYAYVFAGQRLQEAEHALELLPVFEPAVAHLLLGLRAFQHLAQARPDLCDDPKSRVWAQYGSLVHLLASRPLWDHLAGSAHFTGVQADRQALFAMALDAYKRALTLDSAQHELWLFACHLTEKVHHSEPSVYLAQYLERAREPRCGKDVRYRLLSALSKLCMSAGAEHEPLVRSTLAELLPDADLSGDLLQVLLGRLVAMIPSSLKEVRDAHRIVYRSAAILAHLGRWAEAAERLLVIMLPRRGNVGPTMRAINTWEGYGKYCCFSEKYTRLLLRVLEQTGDIGRLAECHSRLVKKPLDILHIDEMKRLALDAYMRTVRAALVGATRDPPPQPVSPEAAMQSRSDPELVPLFEAIAYLTREYSESSAEVTQLLEALYAELCARLPADERSPVDLSPIALALAVGRAWIRTTKGSKASESHGASQSASQAVPPANTSPDHEAVPPAKHSPDPDDVQRDVDDDAMLP